MFNRIGVDANEGHVVATGIGLVAPRRLAGLLDTLDSGLGLGATEIGLALVRLEMGLALGRLDMGLGFGTGGIGLAAGIDPTGLATGMRETGLALPGKRGGCLVSTGHDALDRGLRLLGTGNGLLLPVLLLLLLLLPLAHAEFDRGLLMLGNGTGGLDKLPALACKGLSSSSVDSRRIIPAAFSLNSCCELSVCIRCDSLLAVVGGRDNAHALVTSIFESQDS